MNVEVLNHYLSQVLGLSSVQLPEGCLRSSLPLPEVDVRPVAVLTPYELSKDEHELVNKMLSAVGVHLALYLNAKEHGSDIQAAHLKVHQSRYLLCFGIKLSFKASEVQSVELPSITSYFDDSDASQLAKLKRNTWNQLKVIKSKLEGRL